MQNVATCFSLIYEATANIPLYTSQNTHQAMLINPAASCQVMFSSDVAYTTELLEVSKVSCTLHSAPFRQGVAIYDPALLALELGGNKISIVGTLERMQSCNHCNAKSILATFIYPELDLDKQQWIKHFRSHALCPAW